MFECNLVRRMWDLVSVSDKVHRYHTHPSTTSFTTLTAVEMSRIEVTGKRHRVCIKLSRHIPGMRRENSVPFPLRPFFQLSHSSDTTRRHVDESIPFNIDYHACPLRHFHLSFTSTIPSPSLRKAQKFWRAEGMMWHDLTWHFSSALHHQQCQLSSSVTFFNQIAQLQL